ncbi:unnamed protein product [Urochloa humidicola]
MASPREERRDVTSGTAVHLHASQLEPYPHHRSLRRRGRRNRLPLHPRCPPFSHQSAAVKALTMNASMTPDPDPPQPSTDTNAPICHHHLDPPIFKVPDLGHLHDASNSKGKKLMSSLGSLQI